MRFLGAVLLASGLTGLGLLFPAAWILVAVGLGAFFFLILFRTATAHRAALAGALYGGITGAAAIAWFWATLPLDWLHIVGTFTQVAAVGIAWGVVSIGFSIATALGALALWQVRENHFILLALPLLWMVTEYARMWSFALVTYGAGSLVGPHFSGAALGYALAETPLLILARLGGIHALDFALALIAGTGAIAVHQGRNGWRPVLISCALLTVLVILTSVHFSAPRMTRTITASLVSTAVSVENTEPGIEHEVRLLSEALAHGPDLIVLPERYPVPTLMRSVATTSKETLIIGAGHENNPDGTLRSELAYVSTEDGTLARYQKMFLMPLGEYSPAFARIAYSLFDDPRLSGYANRLPGSVRPGRDVVGVTWKGVGIGGVICSDDLSPILYRRLANTGNVRILVNSANPAWFHTSRLLYAKTLEMGKVHAVENGTYYLLSANNAPSFAISPSGKLIASSPWGYEGITNVTLELP